MTLPTGFGSKGRATIVALPRFLYFGDKLVTSLRQLVPMFATECKVPPELCCLANAVGRDRGEPLPLREDRGGASADSAVAVYLGSIHNVRGSVEPW